MIKTLFTLAAFFCLGLAVLSLAPPESLKPDPQASFLKVSPKTLENIPFGVAVLDGSDIPVKHNHGDIINRYAKKYGVDKHLVRAVIQQESGGNCQAVSPKGAQGLMQLMPATAKILGVEDPFDPEENIKGGVKFLRDCLNRFNQNTALALAAYNAGPKAVEKYHGIPPYKETKRYVAQVLKAYRDNS